MMKYRDVTTPVTPPSVLTDVRTNLQCKLTNTVLHWRHRTAHAKQLKERRSNPQTGWLNFKPCTTTPPTANERLRTTSTPCKKKSRNWRTTPKPRKTKQPVRWLRLHD